MPFFSYLMNYEHCDRYTFIVYVMIYVIYWIHYLDDKDVDTLDIEFSEK